MNKRMKRIWSAVLVWSLLGIASLALVRAISLPPRSDRQALEDLVTAARQSLVNRSFSGMTSCISSDYQDAEGLTRADVSRIVRSISRNVNQADVTITSEKYAIAGPNATGHFTVDVTFHSQGMTMPWPMTLDVQFAKQSLGWRHLWQKAWMIKSVNGHGVDKDYPELI